VQDSDCTVVMGTGCDICAWRCGFPGNQAAINVNALKQYERDVATAGDGGPAFLCSCPAGFDFPNSDNFHARCVLGVCQAWLPDAGGFSVADELDGGPPGQDASTD
jgi:hypothetical protein